jgi:hypothetical protein
VVHVHRGLRQAVQAGHVVFVHMTQHDGIDAIQRRPDAVGHQRRIEGHAQVRTGHDHLVAVGVLAVAVAEKYGHGADLLAGDVHRGASEGLKKEPSPRGGRGPDHSFCRSALFGYRCGRRSAILGP